MSEYIFYLNRLFKCCHKFFDSKLLTCKYLFFPYLVLSVYTVYWSCIGFPDQRLEKCERSVLKQIKRGMVACICNRATLTPKCRTHWSESTQGHLVELQSGVVVCKVDSKRCKSRYNSNGHHVSYWSLDTSEP